MKTYQELKGGINIKMFKICKEISSLRLINL